jgi:hypothetical protein
MLKLVNEHFRQNPPLTLKWRSAMTWKTPLQWLFTATLMLGLSGCVQDTQDPVPAAKTDVANRSVSDAAKF